MTELQILSKAVKYISKKNYCNEFREYVKQFDTNNFNECILNFYYMKVGVNNGKKTR